MTYAPTLLGDLHVVRAITPIDLASAAQDGDWVSLKNYNCCLVVYQSDVGTNNQDVSLTLRQAKSAGGANAKALSGRWYSKQDATVGDVTEADTDSESEVASFRDDGETACLAYCEISADMLDVANDYRFVQVRASDPGATAGKLGSAVYVLGGARYKDGVTRQKPAVS
ncbi:MAG: hypothetical protein OXG72_16640 [Acidobacteria bacterium]|nr:hypothetical protein [Acidobacteriota bacterium]